MKANVLGRSLELMQVSGQSCQLLFADDTTLVADSEQELCRLVSEFGRL